MSTPIIYNTKMVWGRRVCPGVQRLSLLFVAVLLALAASSQPETRYTSEHPLVIVGDYDIPPYEFLSTSGQPTGIIVDVLDQILSQMDVPHKFQLVEWNKATDLFERHEADLIIDIYGLFRHQPYHDSRNSLLYYKLMLASRVGGVPPATVDQLKGTKRLVVRSDDKLLLERLKSPLLGLRFDETSAHDALVGIFTNKYDYFIWGEEPLLWKLRELSLSTDIMLTPINLPVREAGFAGHDKDLVNQIDDQLARLQQTGELAPILDKWLHPERRHDNASLMAVYITLAILVLAVALILTNRLRLRRLRMAKRTATDVENMMRQALSMGSFSVIEYNVKTNRLTNRHGNMLPPGGLDMEAFLERVHPDERDDSVSELRKLREGQNGIWELSKRWNAGTKEHPEWLFFHGYSIAEQDNNGRTSYILSAVKDVTKDFEEERKDEEVGTKYLKMFDSTLVAMSFYDKDGYLVDLNQNMRKLCEFDEEREAYFRKMNMFETEFLRNDYDPSTHEVFHVCQHMYYPEIGIDKYIEIRVSPTCENDELLYYVVTARDVGAERAMYRELGRQNAELRTVGEKALRYEQQLRYLLDNSSMWVWRSILKEQRIIFSRSLQADEFSQTFQEYLDELDPDQTEKALAAFGNMTGENINFNTVLHFLHTPVNPTPHWYAISGMPIHDAAGRVTGHFGIVRDVTELMEAQEKLRQETSRAEDSGKLKSAFLANMSHEIRTPLNAIVGFSDLLQMIDDPGEKKDFIRIIRNNCDMLIRLIDDIIEASNMNQGPLSIEADDVDFAPAFNDICQTLAQRVQEPGVEFIVDNPYQQFLTHVDKGRLQQVITNFTTNAVKYTHQGHIKVGYSYLTHGQLCAKVDRQLRPADGKADQGGLYMYCEDTGAGIPQEKQDAVFERFVKLNDYVQGTGLGLSICKSIASRCNGHIGVTSQGEGHGSTFWIWIPCVVSWKQI